MGISRLNECIGWSNNINTIFAYLCPASDECILWSNNTNIKNTKKNKVILLLYHINICKNKKRVRSIQIFL